MHQSLLENKKIETKVPIYTFVAGLAGFEPTINGSEPFALPLGYSPICRALIIKMAGPAGFEPTMRESKSLALPLGYGPIS